ncbi:hypothetical protein [Thiocystis violacea]|uniref:hypothetical protein n=1 Tax=Thiocystis violacea TaxID=13725 RepID=UPI0019054739|nr:hypothetical protein [Thiocystis violacea]MBK1724395.1 hypothetical protein [Thiocystis violacea]
MKRPHRKDAVRRQRYPLLAGVDRAAKLLVLILLATILEWLISTNDQRLGYLGALGLADLIDRFAGREFVLSGPGFEHRLVRFPPKPQTATDPRPRVELVQTPEMMMPRLQTPQRPTRVGHDAADLGQRCGVRPVRSPS